MGRKTAKTTLHEGDIPSGGKRSRWNNPGVVEVPQWRNQGEVPRAQVILGPALKDRWEFLIWTRWGQAFQEEGKRTAFLRVPRHRGVCAEFG